MADKDKKSATGQDLERARYIQRMFEKAMDKTDAEKPFHARMKEAAERLDKKLGKEWRSEANPEGVEFVEIEIVGDSGGPLDEDGAKKFYEKLALSGDAEGLGEGPDAPEEGERSCGREAAKQEFMHAVTKLLEKL
jgi:hypothetical protein